MNSGTYGQSIYDEADNNLQCRKYSLFNSGSGKTGQLQVKKKKKKKQQQHTHTWS